MKIAIFSIVILAMGWRVISNLRALISNLRWLNKPQLGNNPPKTKFVICIPAMNEQDHIAATLHYFAAMRYPKDLFNIVVATTERDTAKGSQTTRRKTESCARRLNKEHSGLVSVSHYPIMEGSKPRQIAHAVQGLRSKLEDPNTYFAIFDADSRPSQDMLRSLDGYIQSKSPKILQQLSLYVTPESTKRNFGGYMASGAAIHQSLWTLAHEITRYRKQSSRVGKLRGRKFSLSTVKNARIANCVAHGLFVQGPHYLKHPLPKDLLTEDWPYGFMQCALRQAIHGVPSFDIAVSPAKPINIYRQKSTWFNPFFELNPFIRTLLHRKLYVSKAEVYFLEAQAYASLLVFLLHSIVWAGSALLALSIAPWALSMWVALFAVYWLIPAYMYRVFVRQRGLPLDSSHKAIWLGSLYVLSHSVGPTMGCARWLASALRGLRPNREKTEYL